MGCPILPAAHAQRRDDPDACEVKTPSIPITNAYKTPLENPLRSLDYSCLLGSGLRFEDLGVRVAQGLHPPGWKALHPASVPGHWAFWFSLLTVA